MLGEVIKILAEEPEKIEKAILRGIKLMLNVLIAVHLYKLIFGNFLLFPLNSYADWTEFFLSGRILICLLFYFISGYLVNPLINIFSYWIALLFTKLKVRPSSADFRLLLKMLNIIEYKNSMDTPAPGRNIDVFYNLSRFFAEDEARGEVESLKNTFIGNILNLYSVFFIIYFFLIDSDLRTNALDIIISALFIIVLGFYAIIHGVLEYMLKHYQEIIAGLSFVKTNAVVMSVLSSYGIYPVLENKLKVFMRGGKEYVIVPALKARPNRLGEIDRFINKWRKENRIFLVIIEQGLIENATELVAKYTSILILVEYPDEDGLRVKLKLVLEEINK